MHGDAAVRDVPHVLDRGNVGNVRPGGQLGGWEECEWEVGGPMCEYLWLCGAGKIVVIESFVAMCREGNNNTKRKQTQSQDSAGVRMAKAKKGKKKGRGKGKKKT